MRFYRFFALVFVTTFFASLPTWAEKSTVVPANSKVEFSLRHFTGRASGRFKDFDGTLNFNAKDPEKSSVSFQVSVDSIDTDNSKRDAHLVAPDYFDESKFPKMTFKSIAFKSVGKDRYKVTGPLTIKGVSLPVSATVTLAKDAKLWTTGAQAKRFTGAFEIDRVKFGVGEESSFLGNEVRIELDLEFQNVPTK